MERMPEWEADVLLSDGGTMHVRPIRPSDRHLLEAFHGRQSPESIYYRYFSPRPTLSDADLERLTHVDYVDRMAFVGLLGSELVGVARYDRYPASGIAEVAFFTDDAQRGRGMATVLLEYLAAAAREAGLAGFVAQVLPENRRMLSVFASAGFEVRSQFADGVIEVELGIEPTDAARTVIEDRARVAFVRSVRRILNPASIAVVGVSRDPDAVGSRVVQSLIDGGFTGRVHPVGRSAIEASGLTVDRSLLDVRDDIDIAVICVPAAAVRRVVAECGRRHVHGLVVITAGFSDAGPDGADREREMVTMARRMGMRVIGPNSMGIINASPDIAMRATFVDVHPLAGSIAVSSQSGTLGAAIIEHAARRRLGISTFVALGNRPDVSNNDLLQFWEGDDATQMVLLYLESFGNPTNFARITRRLARAKPVVAVKSAGALQLLADDAGVPVDASVDALVGQTGTIRVDTLTELFDVAQILESQPVAKGPRLAILTNSSGPARLAMDAARGVDLELAPVAYAGRDNPVDLGFQADAATFGDALAHLCADPEVDAVLALCTPPLPGAVNAYAEQINQVAATATVPVVATYLGLPVGSSQGTAPTVPVFDFPESAVRALGKIARYGAWLAKDPGNLLPDDVIDAGAVHQLIEAETTADQPGWLDHDAATAVIRAVGASVVAQSEVDSGDAAVEAAGQLGWPVALKAGGIARPAKTEAGGVAVDIHDAGELRRAHARMVELLGTAMQRCVVQQMAPPGVDVRIGLMRSNLVGAVLSLEVDRTYLPVPVPPILQVVPCSDTAAESMIERSQLLDAYADMAFGVVRPDDQARAAVREALVDLLCRLSVLADTFPDVAAVVLDPIMVSSKGAFVTDVRVRASPSSVPGVDGLRQLGSWSR